MRSLISIIRAFPFLIILLFAASYLGVPIELFAYILGIIVVLSIVAAIIRVVLSIFSSLIPNQTKNRTQNRLKTAIAAKSSNATHHAVRLRVTNSNTPTRGLIIESAPLENILAGRKTWEMRSKKTNIRGPIALIRKGSGKIYGLAKIVDSIGPFTESEMLNTRDKHRMSSNRLSDPRTSKWRHAWVLEDVVRLDSPIDYVQKRGPVSFVILDKDAISNIEHYNKWKGTIATW